MGLAVVGAGFGRTGTLSLKAALEKLGYGMGIGLGIGSDHIVGIGELGRTKLRS